MKLFDVAIIGGGAAGLFCAANLNAGNALLLDHKERFGKKILITGGGMCNLTNTNGREEFLSHFGSKEKRNFLLPALQTFDQQSLMDWFTQRGLQLTTREDGKVFPSTLDANTVVDLLISEAKRHSVALQTDSTVNHCSKQDDGTFLIETNNLSFRCKSLVIATGGMSYANTGSDGSGYALAKALGHSIIPPTPALAAVKIDAYRYTSLAGNALRGVLVDFTHGGDTKRYASTTGDILFTHDGLSGPAILNASRHINSGDTISCTLLDTKDRNSLVSKLEKALMGNPKKQVTTILRELGIFQALSELLVQELNLDKQATGANLPKQQRIQLIHTIVDQRFVVASKKGFNAAMVTAGGIDLSEINRKTMASKIHENLFFCGEVLDYDGDTGGYNLQAAFSTAYLVATQTSK